MRLSRGLLFFLLNTLFVFATPIKAQSDPFVAEDVDTHRDATSIRVTAELIVVPVAACDAMLAKPRKTVDDTDLREQARQMVAKGEASSLDTVLVATRPGQPVRNESIQEFIHPTEYDPPELPYAVTVNPPGNGGAAATTPKTPFTASAFETKNLGTTLDLDSVSLEDGKYVDLNFTLDWVGFLGWETFGKWKDETAQVDLVMPRFYVMEFRANLLVVPGLPVLAGVLSPKGEDGMPDPKRKVLLFVRAEVLNPPK